MHSAFGAEVERARGAAILVRFYAVNVTVRTNFAFPGLLRHANNSGERTGFGADFAAKGKAEAAIHASATAGARLRKNRHRRREGVITELAGGAFKEHSGALHRERRHGVRLGARRIEGAGPRQTGNADFPLYLSVVGLQIRVA